MARYLSLGVTLSLVLSGFAACSESGGAGDSDDGKGGESAAGGTQGSLGGDGSMLPVAGAPEPGAAGQPAAGAPSDGGTNGGGGEPNAAGNTGSEAGAGGAITIDLSPQLSDFTPKLGLPGDVVTITGQHLGLTPANDQVTFGGNVNGEVLTSSPTKLTVKIPPGAETGKIMVKVGDSEASSSQDFEVLTDIPRDGLVAFYPMSGDAKDQSGHQLDGTVHGAALSTDRFGNTSHAYGFNGGSDYITMGNPALLQIKTAITLAAWVKAPAYSYGQTVISKLDDAQSAGYRLVMGETGDGSKGYTVYVTSDGTGLNFAKLSGAFVADAWQLLVFALDGNSMHFDMGDGWVFEAANQLSLTNGSLGEFKIGSMSPNSGYFAGSIDDVAVYDKKLSADEIKQLYAATVSKR
jgi:hypothetical protein